jgi:heat shock protein HspQ
MKTKKININDIVVDELTGETGVVIEVDDDFGQYKVRFPNNKDRWVLDDCLRKVKGGDHAHNPK